MKLEDNRYFTSYVFKFILIDPCKCYMICDIMGMMMTFVFKHLANITVCLNLAIPTKPQIDAISMLAYEK